MNGMHEPRRVVIWGFDHYGQILLEHIRAFWSERYTVVGVFSGRKTLIGQPCGGGDFRIQDFAEAEPLFRAGAFDAAIIGMFGSQYAEEHGERLGNLGIPAITLGSQADICTAEDMGAVLSNPSAHWPERVRRYEFRDVYGVVSLVENDFHSLMYLFDGTGKVADTNWGADDVEWDPTVYNYPMPLDEAPDDARYCPGEYCIVGRIWGYNYGHFTFQIAGQIALMEHVGFTGRYIVPKPKFAPELLALAGIGEDRVCWLDDYPSGTVFRFERLFAIDQRSITKDCIAQGMLLLADAVERQGDFPASDGKYPSRLFVERVGTRRLTGVGDLLQRYGFETMIPEEHSVKEQIAYFRAADVVVTPHGANAANSIYMHPGSSFIETFGRSWVFPIWHGALFRKGVSYQPVIQAPITQDITVDMVSDYWVDKIILESAICNALRLAGVSDER